MPGVTVGSRRDIIGAWLAGGMIFAGVIGVVLRLSEFEQLVALARHVQPAWLLAAAGLQALTYICAAAVWHVALERAGYHSSTTSLVPVSLAMLFANQAVPSAGLSGSVIVLRALHGRGIERSAAMAALLVGLLTTYAAYLVAAAAALLVLVWSHVLSPAALTATGIFLISAIAAPAGLLWYSRSVTSPRARDRLARVPMVGDVLVSLATAPSFVLRDRRVLFETTALQLAGIVLDSTTLYVVLMALGVSAPPAAVFASFVTAYIAARIAPTPLGLGTFEGAAITSLHLAGIGIEAALAATLLFRGFTLWLPMLPGFWCVRHVTR